MFTGIIEAIGTVRDARADAQGLRLAVEADFGGPLRIGESIAVSGPCLTVERVLGDGFETYASSETLQRTTLSAFRPGRRVNLERALAVGARLGGHFVSGHVDGVGRVRRVVPAGESVRVRVLAPPEVRPFLAFKGSIAMDGVSLTIADVRGAEFEVVLIPHTRHVTTLQGLRAGDEVNLEADLLARYVAAALASRAGPGPRPEWPRLEE